MNPLRYDRQRLINQLEAISRPLRVAFAAICSERLAPAYARFSEDAQRGNPAEVAEILDYLWADIEAGARVHAGIDGQIERCMALIPGEDDVPWIASQAAAEDAVEALVYALRCCKTGESQEAAWAAECVYEALDHWVIGRLHLDMNSPGAEDRVLLHPLVQTELARQQRDIDEFAGMTGLLTTIVLRRLRARAREEARILFSEDR